MIKQLQKYEIYYQIDNEEMWYFGSLKRWLTANAQGRKEMLLNFKLYLFPQLIQSLKAMSARCQGQTCSTAKHFFAS